MDFLQLAGKTILVFGVANRKSVAWHIGQVLAEAGAKPVVYVVRTAERRESVAKLLPANRPCSSATSSFRSRSPAWPTNSSAAGIRIARAWCIRSPLPTTSAEPKPFHETPKAAFLRSVDISCYSLIALAERLRGLIRPRRLGRDDFDFDHAHGQRELRLHGADQGGARFVAGVSGQIVQPILARAIQRRRAGPAEDLGLGRHSRLRRCVSVRRAGHAAQAGRRRPKKWPTSPPFCSARAPAASTPRASSSTPACRSIISTEV